METYEQFIREKEQVSEDYGFEVDPTALPAALFDFQRDIVHWALAKGRAAIFADCGLGKTLMQLAWADQVHCMDIPKMKSRDGVIGLKDFPGEIIRDFEAAGFIYHSRVVVWKDPLVEATRTKALGLMHKQLCKDSSMCRNGLPDYVVTFRKPGDNPEPIPHDDGLKRFYGDDEPEGVKTLAPQPEPKPIYSHQVWRRYASPVWMDIRQSNTLNKAAARDEKDERHICPLQLDLIARCLELWTNPDDIVLDPFAGVGSVPVVALQMGRRALGFELKESYYKQMVLNVKKEENHDEN